MPHHDKVIVYSDSLDVDRSLKLKKNCHDCGFIRGYHFLTFRFVYTNCFDDALASFGIGTFFTNDYMKKSSGGEEKSKALNMVIKLSLVDGLPCVKISDDLTKVCSSLLCGMMR